VCARPASRAATATTRPTTPSCSSAWRACRPSSLALEVAGQTRGRILEAPRGRGGFGYDPLFLFTEEGFDETGRPFAELEPAQKARVSHRGRALRRLAERLPATLG
jgi:XTP/dITP diphosphohydrolase